jgi:predicted SAM-dependent methyltransferase
MSGLNGDHELVRLREEITRALDDPATTHGLARTLRAAVKELNLCLGHQESRRRWPTGRIGMSARVQIGGGTHSIPGFLNIDLTPPTDLIWDVREGIPLADGSAEFVFSEHFLEHIDYPRSAKLYVSEVHRILQPGGQVVTGVPDAEFILNAHRSHDRGVFDQMHERWYGNRTGLEIDTYLDLVNYVFRDQDDDATYNPHYWAYDREKLTSMFAASGFSRVEPWTFDPAIANPKRQWGSIYLLATK